MKVEIMISKQAIQRAKKDKFVKSNLSKYNGRITQLYNLLLNARNKKEALAIFSREIAVEKIGGFEVFPKGRVESKAIRIAFTKLVSDELILVNIHDLLYHSDSRTYVDRWNLRAMKKQITPSNYSGFSTFIGNA
jgi:hypothetical protein